MTRCPNCFHAMNGVNYAWMCISNCNMHPDSIASEFNGNAVESKPIVKMDRPPDAKRNWAPPTGVHCASCRGETAEICPDCHYLLPDGWRRGQAVCVALAGARATGKSVFIGVLVKQLELLAHMMGNTLSPTTDTTRKQYEEHYEKPLYEQRGIMNATPSAETKDSPHRDPLIFSFGQHAGAPQYIVLRDVAGEDLEAGRSQVKYLAFFAHADAVLFLFDPLRVDSVRETLEGVIPAQLLIGGDPQKVLDTLRAIIGQGQPRLGVVLSKFDAMQALKLVDNPAWQRVMINPGAAFSRDPSTIGPGYDNTDGELLHHEVRSLMYRLHASPLVTAVESASTGRVLEHRFFAVSALGAQPNGKTQDPRGIASFRCLDPLKWILSGTKVLPVLS